MFRELADIGARDESLFARASEDGHANARVILDVGEGGTQLFHGGHVECVEDLGTINRDVSDGVLFFEENVFGVHKFKF